MLASERARGLKLTSVGQDPLIGLGQRQRAVAPGAGQQRTECAAADASHMDGKDRVRLTEILVADDAADQFHRVGGARNDERLREVRQSLGRRTARRQSSADDCSGAKGDDQSTRNLLTFISIHSSLLRVCYRKYARFIPFSQSASGDRGKVVKRVQIRVQWSHWNACLPTVCYRLHRP